MRHRAEPYFKILLNRQGVVAEELEPGATLEQMHYYQQLMIPAVAGF